MPFFQNIPLIFKQYILKNAEVEITGVSTDTRTIDPGNLFIALTGESFNGGDFIKSALQKGAKAIAAPKAILQPFMAEKDVLLFETPYPLWFYQEIAREYLKTKKEVLKIAITGSAGKTSTKEWLYDLLSTKFSVYKNTANFNNQVGVPLSVLGLQNEEIAIFEMGTGKKGDIARLAQIVEPEIGLIVSIGKAHLEYFETLYNIATEKASLFHFANQCFAAKSVPFRDDEIFKNVTFINPKSPFTQIESLDEKGYKLTNTAGSFIFPFFGSHNLTNLGLAIFIAKKLGIKDSDIINTQFSPLPSFRNKVEKLGNATLILDCYNANPLSMGESISELSHFKTLPILILGEMLELGQESLQLHKELGELLNKYQFPFVFFIGELTRASFNAYNNPQKFWAPSLKSAKDTLAPYFKEKNLIFVKGSRGAKLEEILTLFD